MNLFTKDNSKAIFLLTNHQAHKNHAKNGFSFACFTGFFWYNQFKIKKEYTMCGRFTLSVNKYTLDNYLLDYYQIENYGYDFKLPRYNCPGSAGFGHYQ